MHELTQMVALPSLVYAGTHTYLFIRHMGLSAYILTPRTVHTCIWGTWGPLSWDTDSSDVYAHTQGLREQARAAGGQAAICRTERGVPRCRCAHGVRPVQNRPISQEAACCKR